MQIVVLDRNTLTTGDLSLEPLAALGDGVRFLDTVPPAKVAEAIGPAEIVLCNKAPITQAVMDACPQLRYIGVCATGYNNVDLAAANARGIVVTNVPNYSTDSVAQHAFAFILHFACDIPRYNQAVLDGEWVRSPIFTYFPFPIIELSGKVLGIFGFGDIGRRVAQIGQAFGMRVLVNTRTIPSESEGVTFVNRETVFREADFLTLHCPLTPQTEGLICRETLAMMKKSAYLINTARGGLVVEQDLAEALNQGRIAGAGLDVLRTEPMSEANPLPYAQRCLTTPHVAWASLEARGRLLEIAADNVRAFLAGKSIHVVNQPFGK